jgi:hypothetical protein
MTKAKNSPDTKPNQITVEDVPGGRGDRVVLIPADGEEYVEVGRTSADSGEEVSVGGAASVKPVDLADSARVKYAQLPEEVRQAIDRLRAAMPTDAQAKADAETLDADLQADFDAIWDAVEALAS